MIELFTSFIFLLFLEIILGIDNIVFISLITEQLPKQYRQKVRIIGITCSMVFRLILLFFIVYLLKFTYPIFHIMDISISIKDLIMLAGGLFLIVKATDSIHEEITAGSVNKKQEIKSHIFSALLQVIFIDFVFSLDSLIMAIGITNHIYVIAAAIVISVIIMMLCVRYVSEFIAKYPTIKMLAISFIMVIGVFLILEGLSVEINKGYIYFAMGFSLVVEFLNNVIKSKEKKVKHKE